MSELKKDTVAENTAEVKTKTDDDKAAKTEKTEKPKKDKKNGGFKNSRIWFLTLPKNLHLHLKTTL